MWASLTAARVFSRYDWSPGALADGVFEASLAQGSEYIPMIWGEADLTEERTRHLAWVGDSAPYLLGFNEPNFKAPQVKLDNDMQTLNFIIIY